MKVDYADRALVVRDRYRPEHVFSPARGGNHLMRIAPNADRSFEYLIAAGWSEGAGPKTAGQFAAYVGKASANTTRRLCSQASDGSAGKMRLQGIAIPKPSERMIERQISA